MLFEGKLPGPFLLFSLCIPVLRHVRILLISDPKSMMAEMRLCLDFTSGEKFLILFSNSKTGFFLLR